MSSFGSGFGLAPELQRQEPVPFAPSGAGLAPELRGELGNDADRERRLMDSFRESYNTDPNFAAEAQKFADELGASRATVAANMDVAKRMAVARSLRYQELKDKFPTLLEKFSNVKFASVAHDDVGNLKATESTWEWLGRQGEAGAAANQRGYLGVRRALGWMTPDEQAELDRLNVLMREAGQDSGIAAATAQTLGQMAGTVPLAMGAGAAAAGLASLGGPLSAGAAFTGGTAAAGFSLSAMIEGGNAYEDMLAQGIDKDTAAKAAFGVVAPVNGALEMVGMHYFAAPFKSAFAKLATKKVAGKLVSETAGSAFDRFARSYAKSYLSEIGTEVLQEAVSMSAGGVARAASRPDLPAMTWADIMGQLGEIAGKTAQGMLLPALPGPAFQFVGDSITARQSMVEQQFLKDAIAQQGESKVAKRAPNARLEFLAATARGSDGATTYVRTEAALDALRQDGLTIEDLSAKSPEIAAKLNEAREKGLESAAFPTANYIGQIYDTTFGKALLPHLRLSEASMSLEELKQFAKDEPKRTAEAAALIEAYKATSKEWADSSAKVREDYRTSILQAGRSEQEASTVASFLTAFAETQAYGLGITPSEFVARFPLQVVRGAVAQEKTLRQFAGRAAETANSDTYNAAFKRLDAGDDPETVRKETGWFRGADGLMRFEIDDSKATFIKGSGLSDRASYPWGKSLAYARKVKAGWKLDGPEVLPADLVLGDIFDHPTLFAAYPGLREVRVESFGGKGAHLSMGSDGGPTIRISVDMPMEKAMATMLHEIQHWIQEREGFASGGSPTTMSRSEMRRVAISLAEERMSVLPAARQAVRDGTALPEVWGIPKPFDPTDSFRFTEFESAVRWTESLLDAAKTDPDGSEVWDLVQAANLQDAFMAYWRLHGEVEARNTARRGGMTADARAEFGPQKTADVPLDKTLVRVRGQDLDPMLGRDVLRQTGPTKTDSPEFRAWFGESKVVDEKGKPLVVYHGTKTPGFDTFKAKANAHSKASGVDTMFFASGPQVAATYAGDSGAVYPVYLKADRVAEVDANGRGWDEVLGDAIDAMDVARTDEEAAFFAMRSRLLETVDGQWEDLSDADKAALDDASAKSLESVRTAPVNRRPGVDAVVVRNVYDAAGPIEQGSPFTDVWMVFDPTQIKSATGNRGTFDPADPNILRQGDTKGTFDPRSLTIALSESADWSTLLHESAHFYLHVLAELATNPEATRAAADFQTFATWTGVKDVATWNAMSLEEQRPHHEAFARSFELFLYEGKAPSAELRTLFERFRAWLVSVYRDIVGQLNANYRAEFGRDLPALTPEVRGVMGRMVAADEAIAKAEAVRDMKPLFQTLEESGMTAEEFAAYEQSIAEAHEASVTDLGKASLRQMQWLTGARARLTKQLQSKNEKLRREAEREVEQTIALEPVYRVERWLRRGELVSQDGKVEKEPGPDHKLNVAEVRKMLGLVVPEKLPKRAKERMERPVKRAKQRPKSMVTRIRELGGISRYSWESTYPGERRGEFKIKGVVRGKRNETAATSSGGMTWEDMAKALQSDGYGPQQGEEVDAADYSWFVDALTDAANGSPTYRESDYYAGENAEPDTRAPESPEERAARLEAEAESEAERAAIQSEEDLDAATVDPWDLGNTSPQDALLRLGYGKFGMLSKDGHGLDAVAEMFGFASGEQLLRELLTAPRLDARVAMEADALMLDRHGDMATPEAREAAVEEALHNEARMRFVATELRWLSKSTEPVRIMVQAAQEAAREAIAALPVRQLTPRTFALAEARSARLAAKEAKAGNMVEAVRAKRQQLLHSHMAAEALKARREVDTAKADFKRFFRADDKLAKTRNVDFVNAGRAVLAWYGLGPKGDKPPGAYVKALRDYNPTLYAEMEPTLARVVDTPRDYRDLTTDEFRALVVTVDALWDASKRSRQITVEGQKRELAEVTGEVLARLSEIGVPEVLPGERADVTKGQRAIRGIHQIGAALKRVEHWADTLDGGKAGPFTRYVWRPVQQAIDAYRVQRNKVVKSYVDLLGTIEWTQGKIDAPELGYTFGTDNGGGGMETLLGALLHTGNESNYRKLLLGRGWGDVDAEGALVTNRWDAFIARMIAEGRLTKEHFDWVQKVWDLTESLKPEAQKAWHEINGFYFKEVEADARTVTFTDGRTATYRGGYVPAKVDGFLVRDADVHQKLAELEADFRNSQPSVATGFGKSRVEGYTKALSLDVRKIAAHLDSVVRFIHVQPAIRSVLKVVNDRAVSATLSRVDSTAVNDLILPWLNRAAQQQTMEGDPSSLVNKFWNAVRKRTGMSAMFASLSNAMQQLTGYFPAALKVAPRYLKGGLAAYAKDFRGTTEEVAKRSEFMATRLDNQTFEIADAMNDVLVNPTRFDKVKKWSDRHAYFLQSAFQNQVDVVTWLGAYNQSIEAQGAIDPATAEREAVQKADAAVRLTQGSRDPESLARFEASTPFVKLFTQFSGYFNMLANLNASEYRKLFRELGWGAFGRKGAGRLAMLYVLGFGAPTLIADAIAKSFAGKWDDEEGDGYSDDLAAWFFAANAKGAVSLIPGVGPAVNAVIRGVSSSSPYDDRMSLAPSITALEAATFGVAKTAENVAQGKLSGRNVRDVLTLLTLLTGVPVSALGKPIGYAMDANAGKFEPTGPVDYGRGMLTGIASEASKR